MQPDPDIGEGADLALALRDHGFLVLRGIMPVAEVAALDRGLGDAFSQTPFSQGAFYGGHTKRFGRVLARARKSATFVMHPLILSIAGEVLGPFCDTLQLNLAQGLAVHPDAPAQPPHRDEDMWRGETGGIEYLVNVMWPFTQYTPENGATRLWPGSHGLNGKAVGPDDDAIIATMAPGDALLFLGSMLHGAGANHSRVVRRGMIVSYCLGWLKPYENQWLVYPPDVARTFDPDLAALVGYRQHRPNLGNVDGQCPSRLLADRPDGPIGAIDALRPDQEAAIADFVASQP